MEAGAPRLEDIPNIGPRMADRLRKIGIQRPSQLRGKDPRRMYLDLCEKTSSRQDPCVMDIFISAVRFVETGRGRPWWAFTAERKRLLAAGGRKSI